MKRIALLVPILFLLAACNRATQEAPPTPTRSPAGPAPAAQALVTATLPLSTPIGGRALATAAPAGTVAALGTARVVATAALPAGTPSAAGTVRPLTTAALPVGTPSALATSALPMVTPGTGAALPRATAALPVSTPAPGATLSPPPVGTPRATLPAYPAPTMSAAVPVRAPATRYDVADAGISFDVPTGWQRQPVPEWRFAPLGATSPQLGVKWADMGPGWQPTSMLPAGANVLTMGSLASPLGAATVYILLAAGAATPGPVAQAGEIHVVVQATNGRAYDFYGTANRVEDLLALQPALLQMVSSATPRR
ncbi:MAG: hypothetical protein U0641_00555 [Anaerolineae bacterium]